MYLRPYVLAILCPCVLVLASLCPVSFCLRPYVVDREKQWHYKETKQNDIKKKIASYYVLFENENNFLLLYFICLLCNLQLCQIVLPDPV